VSRIREFLDSEEWDAPFFKRLARNDTGEAAGHQGGMVVTKDLRQFFPTLDEGKTSRSRPTTDRNIRVEMFLGVKQIAEGMVRYQFQTWSGKRSPESRITQGLGPLHGQAKGGDILIFQRNADAVDRFRLILIRKSSPAFKEVNNIVAGRPRGPLFEDNEPVTQSELDNAADELDVLADQPFSLIKTFVRIESRQLRVARSSVFPLLVRREYEWRCCISGIQIETPNRIHEVEAAHVVPVTEGGTDDVRNGLSLSRTLHWAFDQGLFGIQEDRTIYIPRRVTKMPENMFLKQFHGQPIRETKTRKLRVHDDALAWHREHRVKQWNNA